MGSSLVVESYDRFILRSLLYSERESGGIIFS